MKYSIVRYAIFVAVSVIFAQVAQAASWDMTNETFTAVSGYEGDSSVSLDAPQDFAFSMITWGERSNKAWRFQAPSAKSAA